MPQPGLIVRILVASPSDCIQERKAVPEVIYSWNAANSLQRAAILEPVLWETHATPALGDRPQALINEQLVHQCDALVGVFWTRLGTSTGVAECGTAEEIEEFRKAGKPVLLYFSSVPVVLESIDLEQYRSLTEYKKKLQDQGLVFSYGTVGEFRQLLQRHLTSKIGDLLASADKALVPTPSDEEEQIKAVQMFKFQFEAFIRRFEAEWSAERDTEPEDIEDGKYILEAVAQEVVNFKAQITRDEGSDLSGLLQSALKQLKELGRHELYIDGGVSYREFWEKGDQVLGGLKKVPELLEQLLAGQLASNGAGVANHGLQADAPQASRR